MAGIIKGKHPPIALEIFHRRPDEDFRMVDKKVAQFDIVLGGGAAILKFADVFFSEHGEYSMLFQRNLGADVSAIASGIMGSFEHSMAIGVYNFEHPVTNPRIYLDYNLEFGDNREADTLWEEIRIRPSKISGFSISHEFGHMIQFLTQSGGINDLDRVLCEGGADLFSISFILRDSTDPKTIASNTFKIYGSLRGVDTNDATLIDLKERIRNGETDPYYDGGRLSIISIMLNNLDVNKTLREMFSARTLDEFIDGINSRIAGISGFPDKFY